MHTGHRQRMKHRFKETGLSGFNDINVLELLLFYAVPRQDTNPLAHALIERFGGLNEVLEASMDELMEVPGVGENVATLLKLFPAVCKRYLTNQHNKKIAYNTVSELKNYIIPLFAFEPEELLYMICMDSGNHITYCQVMSRGSEEAVYADTKKIAQIAITRKANSVVLAHNHPSGIAEPSPSDIAVTKQIRECLQLCDVELLDHFIVADDDCISLRKYGYLM